MPKNAEKIALWAFMALLGGLGLSGWFLRLELWNAHAGALMVFATALILLPLAFYTRALSLERPAPLLRHPLSPLVLFVLSYSAMQLSGGLHSPLWPLYLLLCISVLRFAGLLPALGIAALIVLAEALPFLRVYPDAGLPSFGLLFSPWAAIVLGRLLLGTIPGKTAAADTSPRSRGQDLAPAPSEEAMGELPQGDPTEMLNRSIVTLMNLAHHAHPNWNTVLLCWKDGESLVYRQWLTRLGSLETGFQIASGEGLLGWVLREKKGLHPATLANSNSTVLPYYQGEVPAKSLMAIPLNDEDKLVGVLAVDKTEAGDWGTDEMQALDFLGHQIVSQHQQSGFYARVLARGKQLSFLYDVSKQLSADLDRDHLIAKIPDLLGKLLAFDSYYLALREGDRAEDAYAIVSSQGYAAEYQSAYKLESDTVLGGWVLDSGEPVAFNAERAGSAVPRFLTEGLSEPKGSFMLVPLMLNGKVGGLLKLDRAMGAPFSEQDREVALIFASQAAVTLEHARLYSLHQKMATTDGLTGLYNHRYFQERLALELNKAERTERPVSLALTDIDFFKKFNDNFGHQEGDNVLRKAAKMLKDSVRQGKDIVARYGGEEFVIIMPDCDLVEAREVAENVRKQCAETLTGGNGAEARAITLSIGICTYPLGAKEQKEIIHKADEALYKAKQTGRNRVCSFKDLAPS